MAGFSEEDWIRKIESLLAKAERTTSEPERRALIDKATSLQVKFSIQAGIRNMNNGIKEEIIRKEFCREKNTPMIKSKRQLVACLAEVFGCRAILMGGREYMIVVGFRRDVETVQRMFSSLMIQMQSAMAQDAGWHPSKGWLVSYSHHYVLRLWERLSDAYTSARVHSSSSDKIGTDLVLANRKELIENSLSDLVVRRRKVRTEADGNLEGARAGYRAGNRADIGQGRMSNSYSHKEVKDA